MEIGFVHLLLVWAVHCATGQPGEFGPTCEQRNSCSERMNVTLNFKEQNCYCDDQCRLYGDCCDDALTSDGPVIPPDLYTCQLSTHRHEIATHDGVKLERVLVVDKCSAGHKYNKTRALCEGADVQGDLLSTVPVSGARSGILYKNVFCAVCSEIETIHSDDDIIYWNIKRECLTNSSFKNLDNRSAIFNPKDYNCRNKFLSPKPRSGGHSPQYYRQCIRTTDTCPGGWGGTKKKDGIKRKCLEYTRYVFSGWKFFKNRFCAKCNGQKNFTCRNPHTDPSFRPPGGVENIKPFSLLLNLNMANAELTGGGETKEMGGLLMKSSCPKWQIPDAFSGKCRSIGYEPPENSNSSKECDMIKYNKEGYTKFSNGTVLVHKLGRTFEPEEYKIEDSLFLCLPNASAESVAVSEYDLHTRIQSYITAVGLGISIACLFVCILAHVSFAALRNVPGKCVIGLSASLLVGQLLFLTTATSLEDYGACFFSGTLMHYAFLSSFSWSNCLAFDMYRAFSRTQTDQGTHTKRYARYSLYAWLTPLVFVLTGVIIDFVPGVNKDFRPYYGKSTCWINSSGALLVLFVTPLALMILSNVAFFALTVRCICISKKLAKCAVRRKETSRNKIVDLILYIKLSVIMGLTWIFGLLAIPSNSNVLWYFFIIFNSLQGVLLLFSFIFTKRMQTLVKKRRSSLLSSIKKSTGGTRSTSLYNTSLKSGSSDNDVQVSTKY